MSMGAMVLALGADLRRRFLIIQVKPRSGRPAAAVRKVSAHLGNRFCTLYQTTQADSGYITTREG